MSRIYIAGPMSGLPNHNYPEFHLVAEALRKEGREVLSPHEIDGGSTDRGWVWYMREALKMLLSCDEIVLLDGWQHSRGAQIERGLAETLEMPVSEWLQRGAS
ncbi:DUF4406 domain-containing protein [Mycobacterium sp. 23]|uniref:DUF4406 domain-containing protein n=1 Tax=Mycobacterium sp. 23 TaxID=3400424 RepID=UPI003AAA5A2B